jgi:hypothetical protein
MKAPCQLIQKETDHKKLSEMVAELKCLADKKGSVAGRGYGRAEVSSFQSASIFKHCVCPVLPVTDLLGPAGKIATQLIGTKQERSESAPVYAGLRA